MKKRLLLLLCFLTLGVFLTTNLLESSSNLQDKYIKDISKHPFQKTLKLSKEERIERGLPPNKYLEELYLLKINPKTGRTYPENIYKVQQDLKQKRLLQQRSPGDAVDNQWQERGPNNVGGRTRMVMYDPNDINHKRVFAGGVSGGLWVNDDITDENSSWTQVGISDNLAVTCMAVDPNNSQIMYLGTGELYNPQQALGNGIWKSIDGGVTWANVYQIRGTTATSSIINVPGTYFMTDIIVRDKDGNPETKDDSEVFASIGGSFYSSNPVSSFIGLNDYGIFKSTDEGDSWSQITLEVDGKPIASNDFEIGVNNTLWMSTTRNAYQKGGGRIYKSTDGTSFTLKHTIPNGRRTEIAVSKINANTVYILAEVYTENANEQEVAPFISILKTTDAFETAPSTLSLPNDATSSISADDFTRSQAWYNLVIEVDPTNDATIYAGGINLFRTIDSGNTWSQISKNSPTNNLSGITVPYAHADQHSWAFHPANSDKAIIGNDGGVFYANSLPTASSSSTAIEERTKDYNTTQFYDAAIGQSIESEYIIGGTQDNGNLFFNKATTGVNSATKVNRGDGTRCFIDKDGDYMIVSNLYNNIYRYELPYTGERNTISSDSNTGFFLNAMDLDDNLDILYSNGNNHLAKFVNITSDNPIRTNIENPLLQNIFALKVSPFTKTSSTVFAGTTSGKVIKIENANSDSPNITDISSPDFLGNISSIEFGINEDEIMVTFYNFGVESVWFTDDGGAIWENKEGNFPDINVRCILMNPLNNDEVIIGTELGVWNTSNFRDTSPIWNQSYNGMSNVVVTSFSLRTADNTILASTYGRGLYTGKFKGNALTTWTGNIDSDWTNSNNWNNGVPTNNVDVNIPETLNNPFINSTVSVANIVIQENATLTLNAAAALTIEENITNSGNFTINSTLANSGSLIVKRTSTGNIIYNRYVSNNWHLVSPPVLGQDYNDTWVSENAIASGEENPNLRGIATYNNDNDAWQYFLAGQSKTFDEGIGYSILRSSSGNISFLGSILTENTTTPIRKGSYNSYNLIGNPFLSHLSLNESIDSNNNFLTLNSAVLREMTAYIWDGASFVPKNQATSAFYLAPGQAFFVTSKPEGGTVNFTEALQTHQTTSFLKQEVRPELRLFATKGKEEKYTDIFYIDTKTKGFDNGYDSSLFAGTFSSFEIFTKPVNQEQDISLSIQSIPKDFSIVIPVGIMASKNEEIQISVAAKNIEKTVYLEDKETGIFTLMNNNSIYNFTSKEDLNGSGRFYIHTSSEALLTHSIDLSNIKYVVNDAKIQFFNLSSDHNSIKIYNILGKLVLNDNLNSNHVISLKNLAKAPYIFHLETENGILKKKIIID